MKFDSILPTAAAIAFMVAAAPSFADSILVDVRGAGLKPISAPLARWGGTAPSGRRFSANSAYLELDGRPFPIVGGEFEPQQCPESEWESVIESMKSAGVNLVAFYYIWTLAEPREGEFDFSGYNDVRHFVELCAKHGLYVMLRPGPFINGGIHGGGLPPWLYGMALTERSNDPRYLSLVGRYYAKIGEQLKGLMWRDGGPVIIVQLENELSVAPDRWEDVYHYDTSDHPGPEGAAFTTHMNLLRQLAIAGGLNAPFFSMTGWGKVGGTRTAALAPENNFLVTYGGYMFLSPPGKENSQLTLFNENGGPLNGGASHGRQPLFYVEMGTGSPDRLDFRPNPPWQSDCATALTRLGGSETIALSYYLMAGGTNPMHPVYGFIVRGKLPLMSRDFNAQIGEFGEWRSSFFALRPLTHFVLNYGDVLAATEVRQPSDVVSRPDDDRLRVAVRANQDHGFLFFSNYGNVRPLSPRPNASFVLQTDAGNIRIPHTGSIAIASGEMGIYPFNLDLGHRITLVSATAQPFARFETKDGSWQFLFPTGAAIPEYVIGGSGVRMVTPPTGGEMADGPPLVIRVKPGRDSDLKIVASDGALIHLVTLSLEDARHSFKSDVDGHPALILSEQEAVLGPERIKVTSRRSGMLAFSIFPKLAGEVTAAGRTIAPEPDGVFERFAVEAATHTPDPVLEPHGASKLVLKLAPSEFNGLDDIFAEVTYRGDACRVFDDRTGQLVADNLFSPNRPPWLVSLRRFAGALASDGLNFRAEPGTVGRTNVPPTASGMLMSDTKLLVARGQPAILSITLVPQYRAEFVLP